MMQDVIQPIYKDDSRAEVMEYVNSLRDELAAQTYAGAPVRVVIDDRDIRGGEKKWYHVKRGVPIRLEVGPKDMAAGSVFCGIRNQPKSVGIPRDEIIATIGKKLETLQNELFESALALRESNTVEIDNESDFRDFFAAKDESQIHGGFAHCHFADEASLQPLLKELKVTIRCVPKDNNTTSGTCFATGKPADKKAVFAKAY